MDKLLKTWRIGVMVVAWAFGNSSGSGRDVLELESHYAGDGRFEYRLRTLEDPFLTEISFFQLFPEPFTNHMETVLPPFWTNYFHDGKWSGIMFDETVAQPRLNEIFFAVQSSMVNYRQATNGFHASILLEFADPYFEGGGAGGYVNLDCLVPCDPSEADDSPASLISRREIIPDIKIDALIITNGEVYGLTFSWTQPSTIQLEGSHDLTNWTPLTRLYGDPPQTTWTTNVSLNAYGKFFRLSLVANSHPASTPALERITSSAHNFQAIPLTSYKLVPDGVRIGFRSVPGSSYAVEYCDWLGKAVSAQAVVARGASTSVDLNSRKSPDSGMFRVRRVTE